MEWTQGTWERTWGRCRGDTGHGADMEGVWKGTWRGDMEWNRRNMKGMYCGTEGTWSRHGGDTGGRGRSMERTERGHRRDMEQNEEDVAGTWRGSREGTMEENRRDMEVT